MKKISLILLLFLFLDARSSFSYYSSDILTNYVPSPRLIEPRGDEVDLSGKTGLVFSWDRHIGTNGSGRYYDFRVYKGTDMIASCLIYSKILPGDQYRIEVPSEVFGSAGIYVWSLRMGYRTMGKSRRSSGSFTVTGK